MAPIKPLPPQTSSTGARPLPAPTARPGENAAFKPGLEAPRAPAVRHGHEAAPARPTEATPPAGQGQRLFTLQALSTYAGLVIGADAAAPSGDAAAGKAPQAGTDAPDGNRRAPPGGLVDITV